MVATADLPHFAAPPLTEVVIGVQFAGLERFTSVDTHAVWALFQSDFPQVEEHPPLPPSFETFGGNAPLTPMMTMLPMMAAPRLWFVHREHDSVIQFQRDRLLLNWRRGPGQAPYPRFGSVVQGFFAAWAKLYAHAAAVHETALSVTQAELCYVNVIPVEHFGELGEWVNLWHAPHLQPDAVQLHFHTVEHDAVGVPMANLYHGLAPIMIPETGQRAFNLTLQYRGRPPGIDQAATAGFLNSAHRAIVNRFAAITTAKAHAAWRRSQ